MQSQNRLFDDIAKVAGGALGALGSLRQEIESLVRHRMERFLADKDLVTREEFEAVKAMAAKARAEQEALNARLDALEGKQNSTSAPRVSAKAGQKSTRKKTPARASRKAKTKG